VNGVGIPLAYFNIEELCVNSIFYVEKEPQS